MRNQENIQRLKARVLAYTGVGAAEIAADEQLDINPSWGLPAERGMAMSDADYRRAYADLERTEQQPTIPATRGDFL